MTPFIEEARRMLRLAERDFETFAIQFEDRMANL